jgi:steroid delta-isomerase-like uncharacterized protein
MLDTYSLYANRPIGEDTSMTISSAPSTAAPRLEEMRDLFDRYGEAWASRDAAAIAPFHAEDGIFHLHAAAPEVRGREAIEAAFAGFLAQLPDLTFTSQQTLIADWGWTVRWTMSGTLAQPLEMAGVRAEPGGRIEIDAVDVITVADGALTAKHTYVDWAGALQQLGLA